MFCCLVCGCVLSSRSLTHAHTHVPLLSHTLIHAPRSSSSEPPRASRCRWVPQPGPSAHLARGARERSRGVAVDSQHVQRRAAQPPHEGQARGETPLLFTSRRLLSILYHLFVLFSVPSLVSLFSPFISSSHLPAIISTILSLPFFLSSLLLVISLLSFSSLLSSLFHTGHLHISIPHPTLIQIISV
jgi:hypothetical protein